VTSPATRADGVVVKVGRPRADSSASIGATAITRAWDMHSSSPPARATKRVIGITASMSGKTGRAHASAQLEPVAVAGVRVSNVSMAQNEDEAGEGRAHRRPRSCDRAASGGRHPVSHSSRHIPAPPKHEPVFACRRLCPVLPAPTPSAPRGKHLAMQPNSACPAPAQGAPLTSAPRRGAMDNRSNLRARSWIGSSWTPRVVKKDFGPTLYALTAPRRFPSSSGSPESAAQPGGAIGRLEKRGTLASAENGLGHRMVGRRARGPTATRLAFGSRMAR